MSRLGRLVQPIAASRRFYSIFSSKSRGGRYFNSSKSPKVIAPSTSKPTPTASASASSSSPSEGSDSNSAEDVGTSLSQRNTTEAHHPYPPHNSQPSVPVMLSPSIDFVPTRPHPSIKPNELVLHRFFALHRPCLLLNQPATALFESAPTESSAPSSASGFTAPPTPLGTIDDPPMASPEADADAARQLSRALVMNRVGNLTDWENVLARMGLHEATEPVPPVPLGVSLDSTKRKRRKKMKKHKLKKMRRLQRAKRLRLGR
ncbi:hypothetical protein ACEPAI_5106 [Sanghuangporus weigelae]